MNQSFRLPSGGRIDRKRPLEFLFQGRRYQGYRGDTLASALLANGIRVVGRSFKYHRPRGIVGSGAEEPNAILQVGRGARTLPAVRATQAELYEGLDAYNVTGWPSLEFDLKALFGSFGKLLPAGFYYKTFMRPARLWHTYERYIRRSAGLGLAPEDPDPDHYEHRNVHCDVLVAGGGPAGLAAALAAGRAGARVLLVDEQDGFGGSLLDGREAIDGEPASEWVARALRELAAMPDVTLLPRATVFGYYDHNFLGVLERCTDHLPPAATHGPRQRLWRVRARRVVLATGAIERPLVFGNNDRPGVMLASAVSAYINRWAVRPGQRAIVFTNNDSAYQTALDLLDAGVALTAVVDARTRAGERAEAVRARGVEVMTGHLVVDVQGGKRMEGARVMAWDGARVQGPINGMPCDLLAVSGGWSPALHLHSHTGGRNRWDGDRSCFVPESHAQGARSIGACNGSFDLGETLAEGYRGGAEAALALGLSGSGHAPEHEVRRFGEHPLLPLWLVPHPEPVGHGPKQFVDFQNDTSAADIHLAAREGYRSVEHVKRYTALGFGTDQGKLGNINGMGILAEALQQSIPATGTTTFRPAYTPVTFGAIAGRHLGPTLFDPVRKTAMHGWHEAYGARFEDVGQWKRPWYYPQGRESMHAAVARECLAVRNSVGVLDASTLGKIDIQGPDAAEFLNWVYTNAWKKLDVGRCRYGLMLKEDGMVFDDGVTSRLGEHHYLMTTTTGGAARVLSWLERWLQTEWPDLKVYLTSVTDQWATVSLAGPGSRQLLAEL
ncbi:MAG: sarcosine oxidase subunit alpha family protein, partial [Candidatus Competibacterales bacterium]|nr:sarcosine oxidase subunit alpha family protein [Candidatus Competibacterales bacterium]